MRNHFFLFTVLAVTIWTSRGDQTGDAGDKQNDFYLEDMEEGSGDDEYSSYSSYNPSSRVSSEYGDDDDDEDIIDPPEFSGNIPVVEISGSLHLNKVFNDAYNNPASLLYQTLETDFKLAMDELLNSSPLRSSYITTRVNGFSPGSVKVDFVVEMESLSRLEESLGKVIEAGVSAGNFAGLNPNASSLVIKPQETDPEMTFTTTPSQDNKTPPIMNTGDEDIYRPKDPKDPKGEDPKVEEKNIFDMILNDPIIIAAIVGGVVVILLSIILLFLFVVYRLKKKDEGSYSLDEPAKAKDPTAYWKETKEFYA